MQHGVRGTSIYSIQMATDYHLPNQSANTSRIGHVSQPTDMPFADMESSYADIKDIAVPHGRGGTCNSDNAEQISFSALLFAARVYTLPGVQMMRHAIRVLQT